MKYINRTLFALVYLASCNLLAGFDWERSIPSYLTNTYGFYNPKAVPLPKYLKHFELTPLIRKGEHYGVKVGKKRSSRSTDIYIAPSQTLPQDLRNYISFIAGPTAKNNFQYYYVNGEYVFLYGHQANKISSVSATNETCFGFCFSGRSGKTLKLGTVTNFGINLDFNLSAVDFRQSYGLNFGENIQELSNSLYSVFKQATSGEISYEASQMFQLYSTVEHYNSAATYDEEEALYSMIWETNFDFDRRHKNLSRINVKPENKSKKLLKVMQELDENLEKEVSWREGIRTHYQPVVNERNINHFIQDLCDYMADIYDVPEELWPQCYISASPVPNAWAFPGGKLYFTAGIIGVLKDLDSLLLVVGHEIAHYVARHTTKRMPYYKALNYSVNALGIAQNIWALQGGTEVFAEVPLLKEVFNNWYFNSQASVIASSFAIRNLLNIPILGLMAHSRAHESEADRLGQEVAFLAGAKHEAMAAGWRDMKAFVKKIIDEDPSLWEKLMRSHPLEEVREKNILDRKKAWASEENLKVSRENSMDQMYYDLYKIYHETYAPIVDNYAAHMRKKRLEKEQSLNSFNYFDYNLESLFRESANCVMHSFGRH
jgi:hypothetical protein